MNRSVSLLTACLALAPLARLGMAASFDLNGQTYTTQYNTGSGADHALLVLEYESQSYAFGYSWDPAASKTGYNMLADVAANSSGNMNLDVSYFDFGSGPIPFVNAVGYLTNQPPNSYPDSWFNYFTSDAGGPWINSAIGANDRTLADGSADDWVHQNVAADADFNPQVQPSFPVAVPEPASVSLLAAGLAALLSRRSRR